jgi:hypothetical protein
MFSLDTIIERLHLSSGVPLGEVIRAARELINNGALPEIDCSYQEHDCASLFLRVLATTNTGTIHQP